MLGDETKKFCPKCKSLKPMMKAGTALRKSGRKQLFICRNCHYRTVRPRLHKGDL